MNINIRTVLDIELSTRGSDISFLKPIPPINTIVTGHHHIAPNIKLSAIIQERTIYVQLHDISFLLTIRMRFLTGKQGFNFS